MTASLVSPSETVPASLPSCVCAIEKLLISEKRKPKSKNLFLIVSLFLLKGFKFGENLLMYFIKFTPCGIFSLDFTPKNTVTIYTGQ
jgi:hypothetical protein